MTDHATLPVTVNGDSRAIPHGTTVEQLLTLLGVRRELVAVEINRRLVRRAEHATRTIAAGDHVEVVEFVGGG